MDSLSKSGAPVVLVMHQSGGTRRDGAPLVQPLLRAGYNVLLIDERGVGDSRGAWTAQKATGDLQTWLDWLRQQPGVRPEGVSLLGSSLGGTLALIGCANDKQCVTAIALSAPLQIAGLSAQSAITDELSNRSVLLIAAQRDFDLAADVRKMVSFAQGELGIRLYPGFDHGQNLFTYSNYRDSVVRQIINWLDEHTPK